LAKYSRYRLSSSTDDEGEMDIGLRMLAELAGLPVKMEMTIKV
jgi:hypothetical protein